MGVFTVASGVMYIHLQLIDNIRPLWPTISVWYSRGPIPLTVNSLLERRVQLGAHLARQKEVIRRRGLLMPVSITDREHFPITPLQNRLYSLFSSANRQSWGQRSHLQEVILDVAVEGATQAHRVVLPQLVGLQVEAELGPAILQAQAERRLHLEEHG